MSTASIDFIPRKSFSRECIAIEPLKWILDGEKLPPIHHIHKGNDLSHIYKIAWDWEWEWKMIVMVHAHVCARRNCTKSAGIQNKWQSNCLWSNETMKTNVVVEIDYLCQ